MITYDHKKALLDHHNYLLSKVPKHILLDFDDCHLQGRYGIEQFIPLEQKIIMDLVHKHMINEGFQFTKELMNTFSKTQQRYIWKYMSEFPFHNEFTRSLMEGLFDGK